jgi:hypothetical protein
VVPTFEHTPLDVYAGLAELVVVLATVKVLWWAALAGAPVNVTVGLSLVAVVDWLRVAPL